MYLSLNLLSHFWGSLHSPFPAHCTETPASVSSAAGHHVFSASILLAFRDGVHYAQAGRECHRLLWDRRSARATAPPAVATSELSIAFDSGLRKSPRNRAVRARSMAPSPNHRLPAHQFGSAWQVGFVSCHRLAPLLDRGTTPPLADIARRVVLQGSTGWGLVA